jgi:radical SAM protein with 4Fe4S-binding SPASM domain
MLPQGSLRLPLWVSWEITQHCNLKCRHCRVDQTSDVHGELDDGEVRRLLDELIALGIYQIAFSGGEPFLYPGLMGILGECAAGGMNFTLTSNGWLVTDSICEELAQMNGLQTFQISLDSSTPVFHDWLRGVPGTWDAATAAIKRGVAHGLRVGVVMTVTRLNVDDGPAMLRLARELGVNVIGARRFFPTGRGARHEAELSVSPQAYRRHLEFLVEEAAAGRGPTAINIEEPLMAAVSDRPGMAASGTCPAATVYGAVTARGDVRACIFLPVSLGNVRQRTFEEIWTQSPLRRRLINKERTGACAACHLRRQCGGCRAMAYIASGDPLGDDPTCWILQEREGA